MNYELRTDTALALEERYLSWTAKKAHSPVPGVTLLRQRAAKEGTAEELAAVLFSKDGHRKHLELAGHLKGLQKSGVHEIAVETGRGSAFVERIPIDEAIALAENQLLDFDFVDGKWLFKGSPEESYLETEALEQFRKIAPVYMNLAWTSLEAHSDAEWSHFLDTSGLREPHDLYWALSPEDHVRFDVYHKHLLRWVKDKKYRNEIIGILRKDQIPERLVTLLGSPNLEMNHFAASALHHLDLRAPLREEAISFLEQYIRNKSERSQRVRHAAILTLDVMDHNRPDRYFEAITKDLHESEWVKSSARTVLAWRAQDRDRAKDGGMREIFRELDELMARLGEMHKQIAEMSVPQATPATQMQLDQKIKERTALSRFIAAKADETERKLVALGPPAIPELLVLLKGKDDIRREIAVNALVKIGSPAIPGLADILLEVEPGFHQTLVAFALGEIGDPDAIPALLATLEEEKPLLTRATAARALGTIVGTSKITGPSLRETLTAALEKASEREKGKIEEIKEGKQPPEEREQMMKDREYVFSGIAWALDILSGKEKISPPSFSDREPSALDGGRRKEVAKDFAEALNEFVKGKEGLEAWEEASKRWTQGEAEERFEAWKKWIETQQERFKGWGLGAVIPHSTEAKTLEPLMEEFLQLTKRTALLFEKHGFDTREPVGLAYIQVGNFYHFLWDRTSYAAELYSHAPEKLREDYFSRDPFSAIREMWNARQQRLLRIRKLKNKPATEESAKELERIIEDVRERAYLSFEEVALDVLIEMGRITTELFVRRKVGEVLHRQFPLAIIVHDYLMASEAPPLMTWVKLSALTPEALHILPGIGGVATENIVAREVGTYLRNHKDKVQYLSDLLHRGSHVNTISTERFKKLVMGSPEDLTRRVFSLYQESVGTKRRDRYLEGLEAYVYRMLDLLPYYGPNHRMPPFREKLPDHRSPVFQEDIPFSIMKGILDLTKEKDVPGELREEIKERLLKFAESQEATPRMQTYIKGHLLELPLVEEEEPNLEEELEEDVSHLHFVNHLIEKSVKFHQRVEARNPTGVKITYEPPQEKLYVKKNDKEELYLETSVIDELIRNAVKYAWANHKNGGGEVSVSLRRDKDEEIEKDELVFTVRDNGIGIPDAEKDRVWSEGYRATNAKQLLPEGGDGRGLALMEAALRLYAGAIQFESLENRGTVFEVRLPLARATRDGGEKEEGKYYHLNDLVEQEVKREQHLLQSAESRVVITYDIPPESLYVENRDGTEELYLGPGVIEELLENAIKYTRPKYPQGGGAIHVSLIRDGNEAIYRVQDNGLGIPEGEKDKVWNTGYRATNVRTRLPTPLYGEGRGLNIAWRTVVTQYHGSIRFDSKEDEGTLFEVRLPLAKLPVGAVEKRYFGPAGISFEKLTKANQGHILDKQPDELLRAILAEEVSAVAIKDGKVVGYQLNIKGKDTTGIPHLYVSYIFSDERYRRQGIGRALILQMAKTATSQGIPQLRMDVHVALKELIQLAESIGFEKKLEGGIWKFEADPKVVLQTVFTGYLNHLEQGGATGIVVEMGEGEVHELTLDEARDWVQKGILEFDLTTGKWVKVESAPDGARRQTQGDVPSDDSLRSNTTQSRDGGHEAPLLPSRHPEELFYP